MLKQLHEVMSDDVTINITVKKNGDKLTVMVLPKTDVDDAYKKLPPFTATGSPEEVEKDLMDTISAPVADLGTTVAGLKQFNKDKAAADEKNAAAKAQKDKEKKEKETAEKKDKKTASKSAPKKSAGKSKDKDDAEEEEEEEQEEQTDAEDTPAAEETAPKDPNIVQLEKLVAEGKIAISASRAISAKSIRAKINSLVETIGSVEGELKDEIDTFSESVAKLTGEIV